MKNSDGQNTQRPTEALTNFPIAMMSSAKNLCQSLTTLKMSLVTAESCTGGLLAGSLAAVSGSSNVLEGSFVTYRPSLKIAALGVSDALIERHTVYHPEVARQMATGALQASPQAGLALAITGVAGPGPDQGKPAGLVYVAVAVRDRQPEVGEFNFDGDPQTVITEAICAALTMGSAALEESGGIV